MNKINELTLILIVTVSMYGLLNGNSLTVMFLGYLIKIRITLYLSLVYNSLSGW